MKHVCPECGWRTYDPKGNPPYSCNRCWRKSQRVVHLQGQTPTAPGIWTAFKEVGDEVLSHLQEWPTGASLSGVWPKVQELSHEVHQCLLNTLDGTVGPSLVRQEVVNEEVGSWPTQDYSNYGARVERFVTLTLASDCLSAILAPLCWAESKGRSMEAARTVAHLAFGQRDRRVLRSRRYYICPIPVLIGEAAYSFSRPIDPTPPSLAGRASLLEG